MPLLSAVRFFHALVAFVVAGACCFGFCTPQFAQTAIGQPRVRPGLLAPLQAQVPSTERPAETQPQEFGEEGEAPTPELCKDGKVTATARRRVLLGGQAQWPVVAVLPQGGPCCRLALVKPEALDFVAPWPQRVHLAHQRILI